MKKSLKPQLNADPCYNLWRRGTKEEQFLKEMKLEKMKEKVVIITGASSGIGYAFADFYAEKGYSLVLIARSKKKLEDLAKKLKAQHKTKSTVIVSDLSKIDAAKKIYQKLRTMKIQKWDLLINNAGFGDVGAHIDGDEKKQREMMMLNMVFVAEACRLFGADMAKQKHGGIINVASVAGFVPGPFMALYFASKAFVVSLSKSLYKELNPYGIHVMALCPGPVATNFDKIAAGKKDVVYQPKKSPSSVVAKASSDFEKKKIISVPGFSNKMLVSFLTRILPARLMIEGVSATIKKTRIKKI